MPIDDFTYLMRRGYTYQQLEKMVDDGVNIKELRIKESNEESKEKVALLTGKTDNLSFLLEHGMPLADIKKYQADGLSLDEVAEAAKSLISRGEPIADPEPTLIKALEQDQLLSLFKPLENFPEEEAEWLVPSWIPKSQVSIMAADGGVGKTTLWCHIIAALSNGTTCILDPPGFTRQPMKITFFTTEDSVRKKLRKKLRLAGANMGNIITPDFAGDRDGLLRNVKFGSPELEKVLRNFRPILCIFDPVQGFTPPKVNMGSRNEMRDCMAPLISIGEDIGTTSLIICHTNKRKGASGRDRIADSADLWDIARSVMMLGFTEEQGVRYLSNEKNNYAPLQETILFTIDGDEQIHKVGTSWKRDREYMQDADAARSAPKREDCKAFILKTLNEAGGAMPTADLDKKITAAGYSFSSLKRAKADLKKEGNVSYFQTGGAKNGDKVWHIQALTTAEEADFEELPEGTPTPFDGELLD